MAQKIRLLHKKRGDRRTGNPTVASAGEAFFYAALLLSGVVALSSMAIVRVISVPGFPIYNRGNGLWLLVAALISLTLIGATGLFLRVLAVGASAERRAALARRAAGVELLANRGASPRELPTVPRDEDLVNSPGVNLAYRLPISPNPVWRTVLSAVFCTVGISLLTLALAFALSDYVANKHRPWGLSVLIVPLSGLSGWAVYDLFRRLKRSAAIGLTSLEISELPFYPGQRYEIFLKQLGRLTIESLCVKLLCCEEATYRCGTDVRTDRRFVFERDLLVLHDVRISPAEPLEQHCEFVMPQDVMHSFQSPSNAIVWKLVVSGEASRWGHFQRDFPVVVYPRCVTELTC